MFVWIGIAGLFVLFIGLLFDDVLDGLVPENDWFSLTAIATFLTAFGFSGYLLESRVGVPMPAAAVAGAVAGVALGYLALRWSRSLSDMATDGTPAATDLVGCQGRVVTEILPSSTGEVLVRLGGQPVKLTAVISHADAVPLARETPIVVVDVLSPTRVEVQAAPAFWS